MGEVATDSARAPNPVDPTDRRATESLRVAAFLRPDVGYYFRKLHLTFHPVCSPLRAVCGGI